MWKRSGFTLIELLIVVLIIAILAAIAVPNFLEFQTRAKVSRAHADMRSLKTAMEAYQVDNENYIPMGGNYINRQRRLTSPIAYMTSVPKDVFGFPAVNCAFPNCDLNNPEGHYDIWTLEAALSLSQTNPWNFPAGTRKYKYQIRSIGPDQLYEGANSIQTPPFQGMVQAYDPTNGTVSRGDIYVWGPGTAIGLQL